MTKERKMFVRQTLFSLYEYINLVNSNCHYPLIINGMHDSFCEPKKKKKKNPILIQSKLYMYFHKWEGKTNK